MDIRKIDKGYPGTSLSTNKVNTGEVFKQILDQKLAGVKAADPRTPIGIRADVLKQSDKILNLLDDYSRGLTDAEKTLKDMEPLVNRIEKEVRHIRAESVDKVQNDMELERFINELAVTAHVAVFKFHRGDYV